MNILIEILIVLGLAVFVIGIPWLGYTLSGPRHNQSGMTVTPIVVNPYTEQQRLTSRIGEYERKVRDLPDGEDKTTWEAYIQKLRVEQLELMKKEDDRVRNFKSG